MQVLPYLIILSIHPQIQEFKNINAKIIKKEGNKLTAKNLYQALEIQLQLQMQIQMIMEKHGVQVEKEKIPKILSKEKYENGRRYLSRFG